MTLSVGEALALSTNNPDATLTHTPVVVYIVHHPKCERAKYLAERLFHWFRLGELSGDAAAAGLPVYYRRKLNKDRIQPDIRWEEADLNVVITLVDDQMVIDPEWRSAIDKLTKTIKNDTPNQSLLLPVALHESFYQMQPLYARFNPVRLLNMDKAQMEATLRRAATEATARRLRATIIAQEREAELPPEIAKTLSKDQLQAIINTEAEPPPLDVFLSHAKRDGMPIAEKLRDGVRDFGQLVAWYDANDLPFGGDWEQPMQRAAERRTAALVATVTDAYPTRSWCRREATLARTPRPVKGAPHPDDEIPQIGAVQPVVAVHQPGSAWVRDLPMLAGVPRIGWDQQRTEEVTAQIVDRLVLEMLLAQTHSRVAMSLASKVDSQGTYLITWVPDTWTLIALREKLQNVSVKRIIYPGHGLSTAEVNELKPALNTFGASVELKTYEEV